ncbi:MAG: hypothetical protein C4583_12440 [Anaerolineaceae bacterium]|nr:MAG: hypothetical protein C4583_12440 [Anaerolineaceae bacterium]
MSVKKIIPVLLLLVSAACVPALPTTEVSPATLTSTATESTQPDPTQTPPPPASLGTLAIEIVYNGQWYRETFNYQPDAPNIRHVALVMPLDSDIQLAGPGWAFTNLKFTPSPEPLAMQEDAVEYIPLLDFMYDAPGGVISIELAPGKYNLAVAFIAAALPPPGDDSILYPGVTGGGASTEFQEVIVISGETTSIVVELTDLNGWGYIGRLAIR